MNEAILAIVLKLTLALTADAEATLLFAGDAMMHQAQIDAARTSTGGYDYSGCFVPVRHIVEDADYAVVNLETPLGKNRFTGYPCFNAPVSYAEALKEAGFDLFLTANNHTLDRRDAGLHHTITALDSLGVPHIGTYHDASSRQKNVPFVTIIKGFKIGFLNYTYGTNGIPVQKEAVVDYIDRDRIAADVKAARKAGAELIVCCMHWGNEYELLPASSQKSLAEFLKSQGVELIIGGHPHVVQPYRMFTDTVSGRKGAVVYSLGNFISNMKTRDTRGGALACVKLRRDSIGTAVVDTVRYELVYTVPPSGRQRNFVVYPIDSVPAQWRQGASAFRAALKK